MKEHKELRSKIIEAVMQGAAGAPEEKAKEAAGQIADEIMDAIAENFRSITEVEQIVEAVQAGHRVEVAYWDPEEDAGPDGLPDPMIVRPCWGNPTEQQCHDMARKQEYLDGYRPGGVPVEVMRAAGAAADALLEARGTSCTMSDYEMQKTLREMQREPEMELVYICSQYATRGDKATNLEFAKLYCMMVIEEGKIPICPHLFYGQVLNDDVKSQRAAGLRMGMELLKYCNEMRVCSRVSEGMAGEILEAQAMGMPINICNMAYVYSEDQAEFFEEEIRKDLEALLDGKEHHTEKNGSDQ